MIRNNANANQSLTTMERVRMHTDVQRAMFDLLNALGISVSDPNCRETAERVARMYICELFRGRYDLPPTITKFPNTRNLDEMILSGPLTVRSTCSHHFCPIVGKCWVAIIPNGDLIGLSKFGRVVDWFASRPQIQEELTVQIADFLEGACTPKGIAIVIKAEHFCMTHRGVKETHEARMTTSVMRGAFREKPEARAEFLALIHD